MESHDYAAELERVIEAVSPVITSLIDRISPDNAMSPQAIMVRQAQSAICRARRSLCQSQEAQPLGSG